MVRNVFIASLKIVVRITGLKSYPSGVEGVPLVRSLTLLEFLQMGVGGNVG